MSISDTIQIGGSMKIIESISFLEGNYKITTKDQEFLYLNEETFIHSGLYKGCEISEDSWAQLEEENQFYEARDLSLGYLRRRRTSGEIKYFLKEKGFNQACLDRVIEYLNDYQLINDEDYIKDYIHDQFYLQKNGPRKIKFKLMNKFLDPGIIDTHLANLPHEDLEKMVKELIEKKYGPGPFSLKEKQKINRYLQNKGYPYPAISKELF